MPLTKKCEYCQDKFSNKVSLKIHIDSVHDGKNPWKSEYCEYSTIDRVQVVNHYRTFHRLNPKEKTFECNIFNKKFKVK